MKIDHQSRTLICLDHIMQNGGIIGIENNES